jgi:hypothetical protein
LPRRADDYALRFFGGQYPGVVSDKFRADAAMHTAQMSDEFR